MRQCYTSSDTNASCSDTQVSCIKTMYLQYYYNNVFIMYLLYYYIEYFLSGSKFSHKKPQLQLQTSKLH